MKKIIRRFLFFGSLLTVSSLAQAQDCPSPKKVIPRIIWDSKPVTIDSTLTVRQIMANYREGTYEVNPKPMPIASSANTMQQVPVFNGSNTAYSSQQQQQDYHPKPELMPSSNGGQYNYRWQKTFHATLGLYQGYKSISIAPEVMKTTYGSGRVCYTLNDIVVTVAYRPKIFLAVEAMQFQCTKARVYEHELKHHDIDVTALNLLPQFMRNIGYKNYENLNYLSSNKDAIEGQVKAIVDRGIAEIFDFLQAQTKPHHAKLDTNENYEKEMNYCSNEENKRLFTLIRNGENAKGVFVRNK